MAEAGYKERTEWIKSDTGTIRWHGPHWSTLSDDEKNWVRRHLRTYGPLGEQLQGELEADYSFGPP